MKCQQKQKRQRIINPFLIIFLALGFMTMNGYSQEVKTDKPKTIKTDTASAKPLICMYTSKDGLNHILKSGESFRETRFAFDVNGKGRSINIVATCKETKEGIVAVTTLDDQAVAVYIVKCLKRPVALRIGESTQDTLYISTASKQLIKLPVTITCRDQAGIPELEMNATLDGQPVMFYVDSDHLFALKPGESVAGASKIVARKGWYFEEWYKIVN
ncbi:MAG: hypothetical protein NTW31_05900 [Bacteroidetes bacterium]|nr:hypothetical protein [Bacteroidota bacterium]